MYNGFQSTSYYLTLCKINDMMWRGNMIYDWLKVNGDVRQTLSVIITIYSFFWHTLLNMVNYMSMCK